MAFKFGKRTVSLLISIFNNIIKLIIIIPRGTCRFYPSCSSYAQEAVQKLPLHRALLKISKRIIRCNPFFQGGYDPVE